jgi:hypothetical protein
MKSSIKTLKDAPVILTPEEKLIMKKIDEKKSSSASKEEIALQVSELAKITCPNRYNKFYSCYTNNGKNYKNCLTEAKNLLFCTGQFVSKINAHDYYLTIKEEN